MASRQARALVLEAPRSLRARTLPLPEIGDDDALLRVEACGLCGTDHEQYTGALPLGYPFVPGHEAVGIIDAIGPRAAERWSVELGDRVAVEPFQRCGACHRCLVGDYRHCDRHGLRDAYGFISVDRPPGLWGGYAEYQYLGPDAVVLPVPENLDPVLATAFNTMAARLRQHDEMKEEFFATLSHELRSPITSVREAGNLLADGVPGPLTPKQERLVLQPDDTEQTHLLMGCRGLDRYDERRFALGVLNAALGGGMSSRLFQEIRESRGLAYSVYSSSTAYSDAGTFSVYAGCTPERLGEVASVIRSVLADVAAEGLSAEEVDRGRGQLRGGLVLGLEDSAARMSRIGKTELNYGRHYTVEETLAKIEAVTPDDVAVLARDLLNRPFTTAVVGPYKTPEDLPEGV